MQRDGSDVDKRGSIDLFKIGTGLVVAAGAAAAAGGIILDSTGLLLTGAVILGVGIALTAGFEGSAGDSGGGVGAGSGGEASGGEGSGGEGGGGETGCFTAATPVLLANGEMKPIGTVKVGDSVISREETTGNTTPQRVVRIWTHQVPATLLLHLTNGEKVETTKEHRFFVADRGFVGAGRLAFGATLRNYSEQTLQVTALEPSVRRVKVYNLEVENFHTYFVGNGGLWVHNLKKSDPPEED